ncbi:MAG: AEC family transporter [Oscillospiraceae bacterium]|nr:AEC family transporter [Oscillospiraceae bacterium]
MGLVWVTAQQLLQMMLYMACGFYLCRRKLVGEDGCRTIATLLVDLIIPIVVLRSFLAERTPERTEALLVSLGLALLLLALSALLARIIFPKNAIEEFAVAFSNAGFMGVPLITAVIGPHSVFYAAGYVAMMNILQWVYGQYHMGPDAHPKKSSPIHPLMLSLPLGMLLYFLPVRPPEIVTNALGAIAACNSPLAMILLGIYLGSTPPRQIFASAASWRVSVARLALLPVVLTFVLWPIPVTQEIKLTLLLLASASVGTNVALYAQRAELDYRPATGMVCLSTLLSVVSMPLVVALATLVWQ